MQTAALRWRQDRRKKICALPTELVELPSFAITNRLTNEESQSVLLILFIVALLYLAITIPISLLAGAIERKTTFAR